MTFSVYCISGYVGDKCNCSRCRTQRGLKVTVESEELSKYQSMLYKNTGGTEGKIWSVLKKELSNKKVDIDIVDISNKINEAIKKQLETGKF